MKRSFWSTGITVEPVCGGFVGVVNVEDNFFADIRAAHITIKTYVADTMQAAIDSVKASAEDLGIEWRNTYPQPFLYMFGDGEAQNVDYPANWRSDLKLQAERIGWITVQHIAKEANQ